MRCYHLSNMYLSSIQHGVQSAHSQMELFIKYKDSDNTTQSELLYEWGQYHKTMIILNGGFLSNMIEALEFFKNENNPYPFTAFYESEDAMGGMLTNIAIVLPEKIYKTSELIRTKMIDDHLNVNPQLPFDISDDVEAILADFGEFSEFEMELCVFMNNFRLAN